MKKLMLVALAVFSSFTFANFEDQIKLAIKEKQPIVAVRVFDTSTKPFKLIEGNKLSRSRPRQVCMLVLNVPVKEKNLFANYLQAPAPMKLTVENARVEAEDNQKNFLIVFDLMKKDIKDNRISQCWTFGKNDPIGTYKLDLQFNDIVFKNLEFQLLK